MTMNPWPSTPTGWIVASTPTAGTRIRVGAGVAASDGGVAGRAVSVGSFPLLAAGVGVALVVGVATPMLATGTPASAEGRVATQAMGTPTATAAHATSTSSQRRTDEPPDTSGRTRRGGPSSGPGGEPDPDRRSAPPGDGDAPARDQCTARGEHGQGEERQRQAVVHQSAGARGHAPGVAVQATDRLDGHLEVLVVGRTPRVDDRVRALLEVQLRGPDRDGVGAGEDDVRLHTAGRDVGLGLVRVGQVLEYRLAAGPDV